MAGVDSSTPPGDSSSRGTATPKTQRSDERMPQAIISIVHDVEKVGAVTAQANRSDERIPQAGTGNAETAGAPPGPPPGMRPEDFPDGGKDAWLCVLGAFCGMFSTYGLINCTGVFLNYYVTGPLARYGTSSVSWIVSTQTFVLSGTTALWGFVYDSHGPRWLLVGGTATYVFGLAMTSLCSQYWQFFLAQSIVAGGGSSAVFNTCIFSISGWFRRRRATAFGIVASGSSIGGTVLPIAMAQLTARIGFPWTLRAVALVFLVLCGTACLTVKSRLPPRPRPFVLAAYTRPLREPAFALGVAAAFAFLVGMFLPFNYLVLQARAAGVAPGLVTYLLPILNAASTVGRLLPGMLADRIGSFNTITLITLLSGTLVLALWLPAGHDTGAIVAFGALFGFTSGGFISLVPACIAQLSDVREIGVRGGAAWAVQAFGSLIGSPAGGAIVAAMGGRFLGLQLFSGLVMLVAAAFYFAARVAQVGPRPFVKC